MSTHVNTASHERGLQLFFTYTFWLMAFGLMVTASVAYWVQSNETLFQSLTYITETVNESGETERSFGASGLWWFIAIAELGLVFVLASMGLSKKIGLATAGSLFALYAAMNGFTLAPVLYMYTEASVAKVFLITAGTFGASAFWGHTTKTNLLSLGGFFMQALFGLIIVLIVSWFFQSRVMDMVISGAAVLLFIGITAFDMQKLRLMYEEDGWSWGLAVYGALSLYLDFVNILIHLLRLFGAKKD